MIQRKIIYPFLLCLILAGCSLLDTSDDGNKLKTHRRIWQRLNITDYRFNISIDCFCPAGFSPATIIVRDDTVSAALDPETGKKLLISDSQVPVLEKYPDYYPTIDSLFKTVERAQDAFRLKVTYNSIYGFPEHISVDYGKDVADDYLNYRVSEFLVSK